MESKWYRGSTLISLLATLLFAGLLWSGTIRNDATPYGDGMRIMKWLDFVDHQHGWPVWNPFRNGGYPFLADAEQFWYLVPFVDPASEHANLTLNLLLFAVLMALSASAWMLARASGLSALWAAAAAILISFSEQMILSEQSGRFAALLTNTSLLVLLAILIGGWRSGLAYAGIVLCTGIALALSLQYALLHGLAILAAFLWLDPGDRDRPLRPYALALAKTGAVSVAGVALSAVTTLPVVGHASEVYPGLEAGYEPVLPTGFLAVLRFLLPYYPSDLPFYLGLIVPVAAALALFWEAPPAVARLLKCTSLMLAFTAVFLFMTLPVVGPVMAGVYQSLPILNSLRQFILAAIALSIVTPLLAAHLLQHWSAKRLSDLGRKERVAVAATLSLTSVSAAAFGMGITIAGAVVLAAGTLAAAAYLGWTAFRLHRLSFLETRSIGTCGLALAAMSIASLAPVAFLEEVPRKQRPLHVDNKPVLPELFAKIMADGNAEARVHPDTAGLLSLASTRRAGPAFSIFFPRPQAYTFAYLSGGYDIGPQRPHWVKPVSCADLDFTAIEMLEINYLLCRKQKLEGRSIDGFLPVGEEKDTVLLQRSGATAAGPRVFCRHRAITPPEPGEARTIVLAAYQAGEMLVPDASQATPDDPRCPTGKPRAIEQARISTGTNRIEIEVDAPYAGTLLVPDNFARHWTAEKNGRPLSLVPAYFAYLGVPVTAGPNKIVLSYADPYVAAGLWISAVSLALIVFLGAVSSIRALMQRNTGPA